MNFNNQNYEVLVKDLIHDISYANTSNRGKISTIRQYAEVCIRKILDIPQEEEITLGKKTIQDKIKGLNLQTNLLANSIKEIQKIGNNCTHTQFIEEVSKKDVENISKALLDLYAVIFILYFQKYKFGSNDTVKGIFSILPPILRFIVLNDLYLNDKKNEAIIEKLSLSRLKAFDEKNALKWLEENKKELESIVCYTQTDIDHHINSQIFEQDKEYMAKIITTLFSKNMYEHCLKKITEVSPIIKKNGLLYNNFEQAKDLYLEENKRLTETQADKDFKDIMDFVYLGKKSELNEKLKNKHNYTIYNITVIHKE